MEEILKNWKKELKSLYSFKNRLIKEYSKHESKTTKKSFNIVCAKIEILEKCIKLEKF